MKRIAYFLLFCCAIITVSKALETNTVYLPVNPKEHIGNGSREVTNAEQLQQARGTDESRPAELDTNGHWGKVVEGFQMSIRFSTNLFVSGAPISTRVLIRNTTTNSIILPAPQDAAIKFIVRDSNGNLLPNLTKKITISGPSSLRLPELRQAGFSINLANLFGLNKPGIYHISARKVLVPGSPSIEVSSGEAEIEVLEKR